MIHKIVETLLLNILSIITSDESTHLISIAWYSEDGGIMFLINIVMHLPNYTVSLPGRP
jgi:hypothetical protein